MGGGEPGGGVGHRRGFLFGVVGVVDDFLEADVVVVVGVAEDIL